MVTILLRINILLPKIHLYIPSSVVSIYPAKDIITIRYKYEKKMQGRNDPPNMGKTTHGRNDPGRNDSGRNDPRAKRLTGETTHGRNDPLPPPDDLIIEKDQPVGFPSVLGISSCCKFFW